MKRKPISIIILLQDLEFGGTQRYALHLLKHLDRRLFSPELWVLRGGADMLPMAMEADIKIVWLSRSSFVGPWALINLLFNLIRSRHDILYTLTVVPNIWGRIFGKVARIPVIVSGYRSLFPRQHERWLWPISNRIICNADVLKKNMVHRFSVNPDRIAMIPNGVDTDFFYPIPEQKSLKPTALFIGRFVKEKAPEDLLKAFSKVLKKVPEARLEMIGNGPLTNRLKVLIRSQSLESRVRLIPATRDIRPFLNRAWVLALVSTQEASPNVIIEAMASGLPVVATRVGGIPELVADGQTGILVEPGDLQDLVSALIKLLMEEPKRQMMGFKARERVMVNHTLEKMVRQTEAVFLEAINGNNSQK